MVRLQKQQRVSDRMARITNLNITDSGELYTSIPTVTISAPTRPITKPTGTILIGSNGKVQSVTLIDSGSYYKTAPPVVIPDTTDSSVPSNFGLLATDFKFEKAGYRIGHTDSADSDYGTFNNNNQKTNTSIEFWFRVPSRVEIGYTGDSSNDIRYLRNWDSGDSADILRFKTLLDSDGSENYVKIKDSGDEATLVWSWTENNGTSTQSISSAGIDLANDTFHFAQLSMYSDPADSGGARHSIHIDGTNRKTSSVRDSSLIDSNFGSTFTIANSSQDWKLEPSYNFLDDSGASINFKKVRYIALDSFKLRTFDSYSSSNFISSSPDSDRYSDSNHESFQAANASILTTIDDEGRVTALTIADSGTHYQANATITLFIDSAEPAFDENGDLIPPAASAFQGTVADFTATAVCTIDSAAKKVNSLTITDSGGNYLSAPTVTFGVPLNIIDFNEGETVTQTFTDGVVMSGEVLKWADSDKKLHIAHSGANDGKYHSWVAGRAVTGATSNATGNVTAVVEDNQISENEQNTSFQTIGEDFLDFTESNPFGDPQ